MQQHKQHVCYSIILLLLFRWLIKAKTKKTMQIQTITKSLLASILLALLHTTALAQRFEGGIVAGFNLSQLDGDRLAGYNQIGLVAGMRASAQLADRWQLTLEMLYSQLGSDRSRNDDPFSIYDNIRLNFVEAPVLLSYKDWKFRVYAGGSFAKLINYKVIDVVGEDITDNQNYNPDMFSLIFGATFQLTDDIGLDVRWSRHLNSLQADKGNGRILGRQVGIRGLYLF